MIEIKQLKREDWENYELNFSYETEGYYTFDVHEWDFKLIFHPYKTVMKKSFTDHLFGEWIENPTVFGAFESANPVGFIEFSHELWNNRLRINNLLVCKGFRNQGIGSKLIKKTEEAGKNAGARMLVLETQTCNRKAIDFYIKTGFKPIGLDLFCYTDNDPDKTEVRLEMAKKLL